MNDNAICTRLYNDGEIRISFSIMAPNIEEDHAVSYVVIKKDEVETDRYRIVGFDMMHALMLTVLDCSRHICYVNEESVGGITLMGDEDLGIPDRIISAIR